jgi:serine/threonine protein kinase
MSAEGKPAENRRLGDFEIVRELGRGGMGVVYESRQISLKRRVALKVLSSGLGLTPKAVERFRLEAETAAKLHHTNIVPVYAIGEEDGTHFYAMELIDGPSIDNVIRQMRAAGTSGGAAPTAPEDGVGLSPDLAQTSPHVEGAMASSSTADLSFSSLGSGGGYFDTVARMLAEVADALDYAHRQGVVHRDMKPSNLLLSPSGRLSVNDFGVARVLEQTGMTMPGELIGTPAYMSPEQIAAGRTPLDHRTDIYSLGATLYELLTLHPPFKGERRDQVLTQILHKEPTAPRKLNPKVPRDLETICLKAMEKDPDRRYQTAGAMAEDLQRYLNRFAIRAHRAGPLQRLSKWIRRHPGLAAGLACALVAAAAAAYFGNQARLAQLQAEAEQRQFQEERREAERRAALERTTVTAMSGKFPEAEQALDEAARLGASEPEIQLRRGQIALYEGRSEDALVHLERAAQALPDSVAARAVLAWAYYDAGQMDRYYPEVAKVGAMTPLTAEDYLFLGQATGRFHPAEGLPLLDRAIKLRDSALARLIRADVRTKYASMTGLPQDAEQALDDVRVAQALLPGNIAALTASFEAHLTAACCYERHQQLAKRKTEVERAERDAAALKAFPSMPRRSQDVRLRYLDYIGDEKAIRAEYMREKPSTGGAIAGRCYFMQLYRQGKFVEALEVVEQMPRTGNELHYRMRRAFVLANFADGPASALKEFQAARKAWPGGPRGRRGEFYPPTILLFLGRNDEAAALYRDMAEAGVHQPLDKNRWYQKACEYFAGMRSADELLVGAGGSLWFLCEGHFFIGLRLLAEGDRAGARRHFKESVTTRVLWFMEYDWSRAFLARMENDPTWPPWIPLRK